MIRKCLFILILFCGYDISAQSGELVENGDLNNTSPVLSDLAYSKSSLKLGYYKITNETELKKRDLFTPPNSDGNFMIADVNSVYEGKRLWYTKVKVEAGKTYSFSYWVTIIPSERLTLSILRIYEPPKLKFTVDGKSIGKFFLLKYTFEDWQLYKNVYTAGDSSGEITIAVEVLLGLYVDIYLALDNFSFKEVEDVYSDHQKKVLPEKDIADTIKPVETIVHADTVKEIPEKPIATIEPEIKKDSIVKEKTEPPVIITKKVSEKPVQSKITPPVVAKKEIIKVPVPKVENKAPAPIVKPVQKIPKVIPKENPKAVVKRTEKKKPVEIPPLPEKKVEEVRNSEDIFSKPPVTGAKLNLGHVYFEQGKSTLTSNSYDELDNLVKYLNKYPSVRIRLEGHTDIQGDPGKNQALSEQRVQYLKEYMVEKGIAENRIEYIGYGSSRPLNSGRIEALRKLNRRVEVVVLSQ